MERIKQMLKHNTALVPQTQFEVFESVSMPSEIFISEQRHLLFVLQKKYKEPIFVDLKLQFIQNLQGHYLSQQTFNK